MGRSEAMEGRRELVGKVAGGDSSVLIEGERESPPESLPRIFAPPSY